MKNQHIPLASFHSRVIAAGYDSFLQILGMGIAGFLVSDLTDNKAILIFSMLLVHMGYQIVAMLNPRYAFGRTIAAIAVIPAARNGVLSTTQAAGRSVVRTLFIFLPLILALRYLQPLLVILPWLLDVTLMLFHPLRQTVADLLAQTAVIKLPPLRPHPQTIRSGYQHPVRPDTDYLP